VIRVVLAFTGPPSLSIMSALAGHANAYSSAGSNIFIRLDLAWKQAHSNTRSWIQFLARQQRAHVLECLSTHTDMLC
jgi:hypothetical protein